MSTLILAGEAAMATKTNDARITPEENA